MELRKYKGLGIGVLAGVGGCATVPADLGRSEVDRMLTERDVPVSAVSTAELEQLLAEPLTPVSAWQVALVNNAELQAKFARLGFGAADVYAASRLSNPSFSASWLDPDEAGEGTQRTLGIAIPFAELLTLPVRSRFAKAEFAALQASVAHAVLSTAVEVEVAFYRHAVALKLQTLTADRARAAKLGADLAERFDAAGNLEPRELAEIRADSAEAALEQLHHEAEVRSSHARLAQVLGLSTAKVWQIDPTLAAPPSDDPEVEFLVDLARNTRLDLAAARTRAEVIADRVGFVGWSRWLGDIHLGYEKETETDGAELDGPELELEIPIFDQHRDDLLNARADLAERAAELNGLTLAIENDVRLAHAEVKNARARFDVYRQDLVPARTEVVTEAQAEVNFMLTGIFELLEFKKEELEAQEGLLNSVADYWIARAELASAVGKRLAVTPGEPVEISVPAGTGHQHHHHNHGGSQ